MNLIGKNIAAKPYTTIYLYGAPNTNLVKKLNYTRGVFKVIGQKYVYKPAPFDNELWLAVETDPTENGGKLWLAYVPNIYSVIDASRNEIPLFIDQSIIDDKAEADKPKLFKLPKYAAIAIGLGVILLIATRRK